MYLCYTCICDLLRARVRALCLVPMCILIIFVFFSRALLHVFTYALVLRPFTLLQYLSIHTRLSRPHHHFARPIQFSCPHALLTFPLPLPPSSSDSRIYPAPFHDCNFRPPHSLALICTPPCHFGTLACPVSIATPHCCASALLLSCPFLFVGLLASRVSLFSFALSNCF